MKTVIVIPSRLAASRLPGKPLADIAGKPMVVHVAEAALASGIGPVIVAAGDQEIIDVVERCGAHAVLTPPSLPSGTDRVEAALRLSDVAGEADVVVNLQGDLPLINAADIAKVLEPLRSGTFDIGTLVAPITNPEEAALSSVVKVACAFEGDRTIARGLYFSRSIIPSGVGPLWHHIGIYAWRRKALSRFVTLAPSLLEKQESLEQLRALEDGMTIGCARVSSAPHAVDTPEDLEIVRRIAAKK